MSRSRGPRRRAGSVNSTPGRRRALVASAIVRRRPRWALRLRSGRCRPDLPSRPRLARFAGTPPPSSCTSGSKTWACIALGMPIRRPLHGSPTRPAKTAESGLTAPFESVSHSAFQRVDQRWLEQVVALEAVRRCLPPRGARGIRGRRGRSRGGKHPSLREYGRRTCVFARPFRRERAGREDWRRGVGIVRASATIHDGATESPLLRPGRSNLPICARRSSQAGHRPRCRGSCRRPLSLRSARRRRTT